MKKAGLIAAAVLIAAILLGGWLALFADYSEGYRVGKIIKLSHKGYLFKTWEGTLDFGYLQNDPAAGVATRIWEFSVSGDQDEVRKEIDAAIASDYKAKVWYHEKYFQLPWRGDTKHFVYKVERAG
jgi:hypothetical protein